MTKMFKKWHIVAISLLLAVICSAFYCLTYYQKPTQTQASTRNIQVSRNALDCQSIFDSFEDSKLEIEDNVTSFEGIKTFNLADFDELDLVSESSVDENLDIKVKYAYTYDSETNVVTLTVTEVSGEEVEIIDTLVGVAFVNESGELDAVFDCDGEYLLLSEIQDLEQIQNCGWFKKALKKIKKVVSNPVGVIGAIATVAVPVLIGIATAATLPLVATVAIGAVVGAGIAAGTAAASTAIQDGKVDWEAVGVCAVAGAVVGGVASGAAHIIKSACVKKTWGNQNTLDDHFKRHGGDFNCKNSTDYAQKANDFYKNKSNYQIKVDENGITRVYDSTTNTFGSYNPDGTTKTFFKPTGGQSYFNSQPGTWR